MSTEQPTILISPDEAVVRQSCGKRVVVVTTSELSFCGRAVELLSVEERQGLLVETDAATGLGVWCPLPSIRQITVIPIPEPSAHAGGASLPLATDTA